MKNGQSFNEWMNEEKPLNRWFAIKIAIAGAFVGALGTIAFVMMGFI